MFVVPPPTAFTVICIPPSVAEATLVFEEARFTIEGFATPVVVTVMTAEAAGQPLPKLSVMLAGLKLIEGLPPPQFAVIATAKLTDWPLVEVKVTSAVPDEPVGTLSNPEALTVAPTMPLTVYVPTVPAGPTTS